MLLSMATIQVAKKQTIDNLEGWKLGKKEMRSAKGGYIVYVDTIGGIANVCFRAMPCTSFGEIHLFEVVKMTTHTVYRRPTNRILPENGNTY